MSNRKKRYLSPADFLLVLLLLIGIIFAADAILRTFFQTTTENIVGTGSFSLTISSSTASGENTTDDLTEATEETTISNSIILNLTTEDMANGNLILVDDTHPYNGTQNFSDFSSISDSNVVTRDTSFLIQAETLDNLCEMFDDYATYTGWANLQIYSTQQSTLSSTDLYTNDLPDRDTGYSFDIGLITSTGEVVAYIQKHNEWMVSNSWEYGFVLRYPSDKTDITGITYSPHHFRYVGKVHASIMHKNNYCLEEYLNFLQNYTMNIDGYSYTCDGQNYTIYYIPADASGTTTVELLEGTVYSVSGDNRSGFILTVTELTTNATTETNTTNDITDITIETTINYEY